MDNIIIYSVGRCHCENGEGWINWLEWKRILSAWLSQKISRCNAHFVQKELQDFYKKHFKKDQSGDEGGEDLLDDIDVWEK